MASSGFREPQFSEDMAWLPPWLLPHRELIPDDGGIDVGTASQQACKEMHANSEKDAVLISSEEVRYKSCHLFLSGDDGSPVGTIESLGNQFLHFHLHLSSSGISEHTQSPDCNFHQTDGHKFSDVLSRQSLAETSPCREKETNQQKMVNETNIANDQVSFKSGMDLNFKVHNLTKSEKIGKPNETERCRNLISSDIKDAIELSIAASEALVISEIAEADSATEALSASAILEVALHMKQARNGWCLNRLESVSDCITDEVDETDQLLDLDEDIMLDAFEDVGLSTGGFVGNFGYLQPSCSLIKPECSLSGTLSRVLETPVSINCGVHSEGQKFEERTETDDFICVSSPLMSEKVQATNLQVLKNRPFEYGAIGKKLSSDPFLSVFDQENSKATIQAMDLGMVDMFSCHTPENLSSHQVQDSRENGPNELHHADRFRSRWLGGWTGLTRKVDATKSKSTPKVVAEDTSFMTEHGGVSDETSLVRELEVEATEAQLSYKACELSCGTHNKAIIPSQDFEMSSNISLIDPLCSVVPCSISVDNANGLSTNGRSIEVGKYSSPLIEHSLEKPHLRITGSCADVFHGDETAVKFDSGACGVSTRRQSDSLRMYSTLLAPNIDGFLPRLDRVSLHLSKEIIDWNKSFSKEDSRELVFSKPMSKVSTGRDLEEGHVISEIEGPIINLTKEKINSDEIVDNEGKMQFHQQGERSSPKVLNCGFRRRLQASKIVLSDDVGGVTSIAASGPKPFKTQNISTCVDQRKTAEIPSLDVSKNQKARKDSSASRKRVHFSEAEIKTFGLARVANFSLEMKFVQLADLAKE
ncbi:hypothetical protein Sjap_012940 [Stephania japonica]|uniref:Uncharacterized protein n=1 Tax=Stephania japonica TaxID=461633 RepID=A0AAP0NY50_9MAGN